MNTHPISDLVSSALENIREMVDVNTIIGEPIDACGKTIIPVSKVSFGFGAGGSEFTAKKDTKEKETLQKEKQPDSLFGGGSGAGVSIQPVGFLVISDDEVQMIPVSKLDSSVEKIVDAIPIAFNKISDFFKKKKDKKDAETSEK
jgi:sporulation protein YtfJ